MNGDGPTDTPSRGVSRGSSPEVGPTRPLGPFDLGELVGRGGMGEVWRARPRHGGPDLAVKVLTASRARDPRFQQAFRDEVRAVARLDHPGIIHVFDHGEVSAEEAEGSGGRLVAGSPWLAMELVEGSTLARARLPSWRELRAVLLELLDALAHAHARDLVHRDIKPENVLLPLAGGRADGAREGLRLSDFGAVHARDQELAAHRIRVVGTVAYMPPEQIEGRSRELGPWTDLYALGCLAWRLATGGPVFAERSAAALLQLQLTAEPPAFRPTLAVPEGLEAWLRTLLRKDPAERFSRAADAAWVLAGLPDPGLRPVRSVAVPRLEPGETLLVSEPGMTTGLVTLVYGPPPPVEPAARRAEPPPSPSPAPDTAVLPAPADDTVAAEPVGAPAATPGEGGGGAGLELALPGSHGRRAGPAPRLPFPRDWRRGRPRVRPLRPGGVGTGLFGVRTVPLVGREAELDALWAAVGEARDLARPVLRVVSGAAGVGKSRLVEGVATQLHELGAATVLRVHHDPGAASGAGLVPALARHLRGAGLPSGAWWAHLEPHLRRLGLEDPDGGLRLALVRLLDPTTPPAMAPPPAARAALVQRLLCAEAARRPVVVLLDDLERGAGSLRFLRRLLTSPPAAPLVFLATTRSTTAEELSPALEGLLGLPGAARLHLPPLDAATTRTLVGELLGLEAQLGERIVARAEGNPLFAIQLVSDWVSRGLLRAGPAGFALPDGAPAGLPDDLHALWQRRLEGLSPTARTLLRLAAVLGRSVEPGTWAAAAAVLGLPSPGPVFEVAVAQGLMEGASHGAFEPPEDGAEELEAEALPVRPAPLRFRHGLLVESLERDAAQAGELARLHDACAEVLAPEARQPTPRAAALARHARAAGRTELAVQALFSAAQHHHRTNEGRAGIRLLEEREALLDVLGAPTADPRRIRGWSLRAEMERLYHRNPEAVRWGERAHAAARESGDPDLEVETAVALANALRHAARLEEARQLLEEAAARAEASTPETRAVAARILGDLLLQLGRVEAAQTHARRARLLLEELDDSFGVGCTWILVGRARYLQGELDGAAEAAARARALLHPLGTLFHEANAAGLQGEVLRARGDLDGAARVYAESARLHALAGSAGDQVSMLNLAMVEVLRGRYAEARQLAREVARSAQETGHTIVVLFARSVALAGLAEDGEEGELQAELDRLLPTFEAEGLVDPDVATCAWIAGERALGRGMVPVARRLWTFTRDQWAALERGDRLEAVAAALGRLEEGEGASPGDT